MRRTAVEVAGILKKSGLRVFRTGDAALLTGLKGPAVVKALSRLAAQGLLIKLRRGLWASRLAGDLSLYELVPHLTAPWPAYVSLHSVLSDEGVIEEVPHVAYAVTGGRPSIYRTPLGEIHAHHMPAKLLWGHSTRSTGTGTYPRADREKAFLDLAYLAFSRRSPLELPPRRGRAFNLDKKKLAAYAKKFQNPQLDAYLKKQRLV